MSYTKSVVAHMESFNKFLDTQNDSRHSEEESTQMTMEIQNESMAQMIRLK
jgi:hypothetical protein